jgi:Ni,Fe-hydrogenase III small subunit
MPDPALMFAIGACVCSGGIFGDGNYPQETCGPASLTVSRQLAHDVQ